MIIAFAVLLLVTAITLAAFHGRRTRAWARLAARRSARRGIAAATRVTRRDLQPTRVVDVPPAQTLVDDARLGLAVTGLATPSVGHPHQDVYYVQRNTIAIARGLTDAEVCQRAAALSLSAVMTSSLGQDLRIEEALRAGVTAANALVRSVAAREPRYSGMATTLDVVLATFEGDQPLLHFAHVGSSSIWLQRTASMSVELLTESHTIAGGPLLRAIGMSGSVIAQIGHRRAEAGDRLFITTSSRSFAFTPETVSAVATEHAAGSLHDCAAGLAAATQPSTDLEGITIVAAEIARSAIFVA